MRILKNFSVSLCFLAAGVARAEPSQADAQIIKIEEKYLATDDLQERETLKDSLKHIYRATNSEQTKIKIRTFFRENPAKAAPVIYSNAGSATLPSR